MSFNIQGMESPVPSELVRKGIYFSGSKEKVRRKSCKSVRRASGERMELTEATEGARRGSKVIVQDWFAYGGKVNARDWHGDTLLHWASQSKDSKSLDLVKYLVCDKGAKINIRDVFGRTPLHWAILNGNFETIKFLVECPRIELNVQDLTGKTCLHIACETGNESILKFLLKLPGIIIDIKDQNNVTPLDMIASKGYLSAMSILVCRGESCRSVADRFSKVASRILMNKGNGETSVSLASVNLIPAEEFLLAGHFQTFEQLKQQNKFIPANEAPEKSNILFIIPWWDRPMIPDPKRRQFKALQEYLLVSKKRYHYVFMHHCCCPKPDQIITAEAWDSLGMNLTLLTALFLATDMLIIPGIQKGNAWQDFSLEFSALKDLSNDSRARIQILIAILTGSQVAIAFHTKVHYFAMPIRWIGRFLCGGERKRVNEDHSENKGYYFHEVNPSKRIFYTAGAEYYQFWDHLGETTIADTLCNKCFRIHHNELQDLLTSGLEIVKELTLDNIEKMVHSKIEQTDMAGIESFGKFCAALASTDNNGLPIKVSKEKEADAGEKQILCLQNLLVTLAYCTGLMPGSERQNDKDTKQDIGYESLQQLEVEKSEIKKRHRRRRSTSCISEDQNFEKEESIPRFRHQRRASAPDCSNHRTADGSLSNLEWLIFQSSKHVKETPFLSEEVLEVDTSPSGSLQLVGSDSKQSLNVDKLYERLIPTTIPEKAANEEKDYDSHCSSNKDDIEYLIDPSLLKENDIQHPTEVGTLNSVDIDKEDIVTA